VRPVFVACEGGPPRPFDRVGRGLLAIVAFFHISSGPPFRERSYAPVLGRLCSCEFSRW
jgi:hypothetical protein